LLNTLGEYARGEPIFECFNVATAKKSASGEESGYGNAAMRRDGGIGWVMGVVLGLSFVGAAVGTV
jgi:hypothetical protein